MNITLQQYRDLLGKYLRPQRGRVIWLGALLVVNLILQLVNPQIMRSFLDQALAGGTLNLLTRLAIFFIVIALVQQLVVVGVTYVGENVGWTATNWLRYDLARHCLHLDMAFHNEHTPGEMIERVDGDVNALSQFFSQFILQVLSNGLLLAGILILLFREALSVGMALTLFVLVTLFILNKLRNVAVPYWKKSRAASADFFGFVEERLAGMEDIRANGAKAYVMRRFYEILRNFWQTTVFARIMGFALVNTAWVLFSVGAAVAFIAGARLYQTGDLTLGAVYLIVHYTGMLSQPMQRILQEMEKLQQAGAGVLRIQELLAEQSKIKQMPLAQISDRPKALPSGPLSCALNHVTFSYAKSADGGSTAGDGVAESPSAATADQPLYVLHNVSFRLAPGRILGLLGRTGSGKTTVARLLARLYDPDDGCVTIGGLDLRTLPPVELRQRIGVVTQNVQLFHATVRDNLTFFDEGLPDSIILDLLDELGLSRWYAALPQGLDTLLAADGGGLSAGEAQLLAFARVFLKDPGLVILDEASSRLDPATEQLIERAVDRLFQNRTAIIIAHRLATIQRADEILILEQGRILEHGPRTALAADPQSRFFQLLQTGLEEVLA
jgi:ABC-type multidrug transport system fused ATPase/permease subunit